MTTDPPAIRNRTVIEPFRAGEFISAKKMNRIAKGLTALLNPQIIRGEGDAITISDSNATHQIDNSAATGGVAKRFTLKSVQADYVTCVAVADGALTLIAKEPNARTSLTGKTVFGVAHTYTYTAGPSEAWAAGTSTSYNLIRNDNDGSATELQRIIEPWTENEQVLAIPADTGLFSPEGAPVQWVMVRTAVWSKKKG